MTSAEAEWLWGWDPTPGIVSVHAEHDGRAVVWRRIAASDALVREDERFRPGLLVDRLDDLEHLGAGLGREGDERAAVRDGGDGGPGDPRHPLRADERRARPPAL